DDIQTVARAVSKPLTVNMGFGIRQRTTTPLLSAAHLQQLGVAVAIYPRLLTAAAIQGMYNAIGAFRQMLATGEVIDRPDLLVSFEELNELLGMAELRRLERHNRRGSSADQSGS